MNCLRSAPDREGLEGRVGRAVRGHPIAGDVDRGRIPRDEFIVSDLHLDQ